MKLKENFVLRQVAGSYAVLAVGAASVDFNGMLTLNKSGALLWRALEQGVSLNWIMDGLKQRAGNFKAGIVLMGYLNPFLQYGLERFAAEAAHRVDFDVGGGGWHNDQGLHA